MTATDDSRDVLAGPLGPKSGFRLFVKGAWGLRELSNLIEVLELQRSFIEAGESFGYQTPDKSTSEETP